MNIVLSAPFSRHLQSASVLPQARSIFNQVLLGGESQLLTLSRHLDFFSRQIFVCAGPEMFFAEESFDLFRKVFKKKTLKREEITHLRFGTSRFTSVLKGARNIAVVAEHDSRSTFSPGMNPFAIGDVLPAAFDRAILLLDAERGLRHADGRHIDEHVLGAGLATARHREESDGGDWLDGLQVVSGADFDPARWDVRRLPGKTGPVPASFLRLVSQQVAGIEDRARIVLVPWNMSDPGRFVDDLIERFLEEGHPARLGVSLALLPFNETAETAGRLQRVIEQARRHPQASYLLDQALFFMSVNATRFFPHLRHVASKFLVDASDLEFGWTFRRLASLGLKPLVFGAESFEAIGIGERSNVAIDFFPFELAEVVDHRAFFGTVHVDSGRISRRQFRSLLACIHEPDHDLGEPVAILPRGPAAEAPEAVLRKVLREPAWTR